MAAALRGVRGGLYRVVDEYFAGGRVYSTAADGRVTGPFIPRVCRNTVGGYRYLTGHFPHLDANDVRSFATITPGWSAASSRVW